MLVCYGLISGRRHDSHRDNLRVCYIIFVVYYESLKESFRRHKKPIDIDKLADRINKELKRSICYR